MQGRMAQPNWRRATTPPAARTRSAVKTAKMSAFLAGAPPAFPLVQRIPAVTAGPPLPSSSPGPVPSRQLTTPAVQRAGPYTADEWKNVNFDPQHQVKLFGSIGGEGRYFTSEGVKYGPYTEKYHAEDEFLDWVDVTLQAHERQVASQNRDTVYRVPLSIKELTASPCSSTYGTSNKDKAEGCAESLVRWKRDGYEGSDQYVFDIDVEADHYYQPKGVTNAKDRSKRAVEMMEQAGITVTIKNP